jgi:hypothetical protein
MCGPHGTSWSMFIVDQRFFVMSVALLRDLPGRFSGVRGFSHFRFGGPGEKTPTDSEASLSACLLNPSGCIVGDSRQNTNVFSRQS